MMETTKKLNGSSVRCVELRLDSKNHLSSKTVTSGWSESTASARRSDWRSRTGRRSWQGACWSGEKNDWSFEREEESQISDQPKRNQCVNNLFNSANPFSEELEEVLERIEKKGWVRRLQEDYNEGQKLLARLRTYEKMRHQIMALTQENWLNSRKITIFLTNLFNYKSRQSLKSGHINIRPNRSNPLCERLTFFSAKNRQIFRKIFSKNR